MEGLTSCAAWPALRATLLLNAVGGRDPLVELRSAVAEHELESAHDPAAVLTWRIQTPQAVGPLPWLPPIPATLTEHPGWGPYLSARAELVQSCAAAVRDEASHAGPPEWLVPGQQLATGLIEDVEVWRAATGVDPADRRILGPIQLGATARSWQQNTESKIQSHTPSGWIDMLARLHPKIHTDPYAAVLAHRIAALHEAGAPVSEIVTALVADWPLPAEQPAAALWWRLSRHLTTAEPTVTHPTSSTNSSHAGGMSADNPAEAHDDRIFDAAPAAVADDRRADQKLTPEPTTTQINSVKAANAVHDQTRHSQTLHPSAEGRWRDWAHQANPELLTSKHWPAIAGELDRLNPTVINFDRLGPRLGMFPASAVLAMLKDHNDPEQADSRGGHRQNEDSSPSLPVHERHLRDAGHPRSADVPRR